jgi:hypothetical protein
MIVNCNKKPTSYWCMPKPKRLVRVSGDRWPEYPGNLFRMVYSPNPPTITKMMAAILTSGFRTIDNGDGRKCRMRENGGVIPIG